jgi:hypothetical protein
MKAIITITTTITIRIVITKMIIITMIVITVLIITMDIKRILTIRKEDLNEFY